MATLKVGVIGFRNNGRGHSTRVTKQAGAELTAVADLEQARLDQAKDMFGPIDLYEDYRDLIKESDTDAVIISLPVPLHYPATIAALKAGKHVLCEKPPACNARQTARMVALAKEKGLTLTWGLQRRYLPGMKAARREIAKKRFGNIYRIDVRYILSHNFTLIGQDKFRMLKEGGGVFWDLGVHALDMAWSLLGCPKAKRVVAAYQTAFPGRNAVRKRADMGEDTAMAMVFLETGAVIVINTCFASLRSDGFATGHEVNLEILGDKACLQLPSLEMTRAVGKKDFKTETIEPPKSKQELLSDFVRATQGKGELLIKPEQGVELMKIMDAINKSGWQGREVRIR